MAWCYDTAFIKPIGSKISRHKLISKNLFGNPIEIETPVIFIFVCLPHSGTIHLIHVRMCLCSFLCSFSTYVLFSLVIRVGRFDSLHCNNNECAKCYCFPYEALWKSDDNVIMNQKWVPMSKKKKKFDPHTAFAVVKSEWKIRAKRDLSDSFGYQCFFFLLGTANIESVAEPTISETMPNATIPWNEWMKETIKYFHNSFRTIFIYQPHNSHSRFLLFHVPTPLIVVLYCRLL